MKKKFLSTQLFLLSLFSCFLEAGSYQTCSPSSGTNWVITPNAGPCVDCGWDAHFTAAYLLWTAREDGLTFATLEPIDPATGGVTGQGKIIEPDWHWRSGFKVGVGYLLDCDGWDLDLTYTWFRETDTKQAVSASSGEEIFNDFQRASANWQLSLNVLDFELGRNFFISKCLTLRPHFGLKGVWETQSFDVFLSGGSSSFFDTQKGHEKIWGVGARAGLDTAWMLTCGFSLVGEIAASGLWERFKIEGKEESANSTQPEGIVDFYAKYTHASLNPVFEWLIGARWETWFCCDQYHLSLLAGWEAQWWSDQNRFLQLDRGDLYLQGLTLSARFDF